MPLPVLVSAETLRFFAFRGKLGLIDEPQRIEGRTFSANFSLKLS